MNIVIPMAGLGSRFAKAGYEKPKPFIDVAGKPMIVRVLDNLSYPEARYILIARKEHIEKEQELVKQIEQEYNAIFIPIDKLTEGTACTVLYARKYINNDYPLLIANSDQIVDINISDFIDDCINRNLDGSILTFIDEHQDPKWSFAKLNENDLVSEVKEKVVISEYATVGIYLYSKGNDFINAAIDMIIENDRVNNEFYTCPTYNYEIAEGKKIGIFNIDFKQMHGIGTPEDLKSYLKNAAIL
ncbi:MAG: glycosyltransferase family 2 protein [Sulfuricurvum sp.]|uniref:glycosyltransferase family 2 protein n=1 Tax=Sulfuricurvum sp. TaxID=2025608 RepID=UPI00261EF14C|nr:glycosyltransferase family 2 protein [Sulfuricurvum sp.]MDD5117481.1 glycosyltransferase family 2 protein [Sulfuricurvum sp.]